jgi:PD-(D/E)XK endonuclease
VRVKPEEVRLNLKGKGDLAELKVATDLRARGHRIAIPFGEDCDFDLVLIRPNHLDRVQVKYTESNGVVVAVKCYSHSLTNGRIRRTKHYTASEIDILAVYDVTTDSCFYVPARELGAGRNTLHLRLIAAKNGQRQGIHLADRYRDP